MREDDPQSGGRGVFRGVCVKKTRKVWGGEVLLGVYAREETRKVGGVRCFLRGKSVRRPAKWEGGELFLGMYVREETRKVGGARCFLRRKSVRRPAKCEGRGALGGVRRLAVLLARYSGVLSHSQVFSVIPSQSRASLSSRGLVVSFFRCRLVVSSFHPFL